MAEIGQQLRSSATPRFIDGFKPANREALVFEDSVEDPHIVVHQELDESEHDRIKEHWSSLPTRPLPASDTYRAPDPSEGDILDKILPEKIRSRVFSALPLRIIKLSTMELEERNAVANYIIKNKLNKKKIRRIKSTHISALPQKNMDDSELISAVVEDVTRFAILSHTWGPDEPSYEDFLLKRKTDSPGYKKLEEFCRIAHRQHGVEYAWADTVCIDKRSSSELDESIRSMFTWYRESFICIIYLADTETLLDFPFDRWFTRGWTLQELLAPCQIKFYNKNWKLLTNLRNDKLDPKGYLDPFSADYDTRLRELNPTYSRQLLLLQDGISTATGIPVKQIRHFRPGLRDPPFPERLKWISRRVTTRPEDIAYSMMGVLNVSFSIAYGEGGERAFFRLFQAALEIDWSPSWFFWEGKPISSHIHPSRILPSSPACYLSWNDSSSHLRSFKKDPIALTNTGLSVRILVVPVKVTSTSKRTLWTPTQNVELTCPLSDDIIKVLGLISDSRTADSRPARPSPRRFALGLIDHYFKPANTPKRVWAVLLSRTHDLLGPTPTDPRRWMPGEWSIRKPDRVITFDLKEEFRGRKVDTWTTVEVPRSWWGEDGEEIVPKIEFQTACL